MATAFISSTASGGGSAPASSFSSPQGSTSPSSKPDFQAAGAIGLEAITQATKDIEELVESSIAFTDTEALAQPFVEAFEEFESTAQEALTAELRLAEDDLQSFQNNNQDVRAAVNLTASREVKSQIFNATLSAANEVNQQLAQGIFAASELASQNFNNISQVVASSVTSLAGSTASFVASLTASSAQVFSAELNHAGQMAQIAASRDIAAMQAATTQRGQDIAAEQFDQELQFKKSMAELEAQTLQAPDVRAPAGVNLSPTQTPLPTRAPPPTKFTNSSINPVETVDFNRIVT